MSAQLQLFETQPAHAAWNVRVSRRARRLSVRVYPGGRVEVVVPPGASAATVQRFVGTHREWIDRRVADLSALSTVSQETRPVAIELPAIARRYEVDYQWLQSQRKSPRDLRITALCADRLRVSGHLEAEADIGRALQRWLYSLAQRELGCELSRVAQQAGFQFKRLQIRRQRTRWGSCSASGTISLNVCLLFQDAAVLRYLLIHELSHTRHMNHSERFWSLVESLQPDYKQLDRELLHGWQRVPGWMFT